MLIHTGEWKSGYLDAAICDGWLRVRPREAILFPHLVPQFFERETDWWMLWNYLRELGAGDLLRKVRSRRSEVVRNRRYVAMGEGIVNESCSDRFQEGQSVLFISPNNGVPSERISLPEALVVGSTSSRPHESSVIWHFAQASAMPEELAGIVGWTSHSGSKWSLPSDRIAELARRVGAQTEHLETVSTHETTEPKERTRPGTHKRGVTLVGYGNYAKTMALPELAKHVGVATVHEIDPAQIGPRGAGDVVWDTAWWLREEETPEIVVIAAFHHQHAALAKQALELGARALVLEKPIATTREALDDLVGEIERTETDLFVAFQKRYSPFNSYLRNDLDVRDDTPISCYSLVYEARLPDLHWYRWPVSGSRIVANGCHWIDHFLWLNGYSTPAAINARELGEDTTIVTMTLENSAELGLILTHKGSGRLGVREHTEYRAGTRTVTIQDASRYWSESSRSHIRKKRAQRLSAHRAMYRDIGERLGKQGQGDSLRSIRVSAEAVLAAEEAYRRQLDG